MGPSATAPDGGQPLISVSECIKLFTVSLPNQGPTARQPSINRGDFRAAAAYQKAMYLRHVDA